MVAAAAALPIRPPAEGGGSSETPRLTNSVRILYFGTDALQALGTNRVTERATIRICEILDMRHSSGGDGQQVFDSIYMTAVQKPLTVISKTEWSLEYKGYLNLANTNCEPPER
jgi:hypothetical protein